MGCCCSNMWHLPEFKHGIFVNSPLLMPFQVAFRPFLSRSSFNPEPCPKHTFTFVHIGSHWGQWQHSEHGISHTQEAGEVFDIRTIKLWVNCILLYFRAKCNRNWDMVGCLGKESSKALSFSASLLPACTSPKEAPSKDVSSHQGT